MLLALLLISGCGRKTKARKAPALPPQPQKAKVIPRPEGWTETGIASWYGHPYHGRQAANGEIYDMNRFTAAHRTLPFETWVRVTNITNLKYVEVRVTDRGPFVDGRIIDLSRAAADRIDMVLAGIAKVRMEVIPPPPLPQATRTPPSESTPAEEPPAEPQAQPSVRFGVQVAALRDATAAEALRRQMESRYGSSRVVRRDGNPRFWRVLVGELDSEESAVQLSREIREQNPEMASAFVVRLEDR